jgi:hypothetical protein
MKRCGGAPFEVTVHIDGREVARGQVSRTAPLAFTRNDPFDVRRDSYSVEPWVKPSSRNK